jgi:HlyD family secretion protein
MVSGLAIIAGITLALAWIEPAEPTVDSATIWSDTVKRGPMLCEVRGAGVLVPEEIRWVTATSPGRIERIPLLPGVAVEADTLLLELSNPELEQAAFDAEALVKAAEAQFEKLKVQLEEGRLQLESSAVTLESELGQARLEAEADEELAREGLQARLAAKRSRAKADDLANRVGLERKRIGINAQSAQAQLAAQEAELAKWRKQHELKRRQVEALRVRAGFGGVLQKLGDPGPLQVGQQVMAGAKLAQVTDPRRLKAEIKVAETQAKDLQLGQPAAIDTRSGVIPGRIVRIDPAVQNGTVTVDVALENPLPKGARPDLSVEGIITLERLEDVLYLGRPVNATSDSKVSLFKVLNGGKRAIRVPVRLGRGSVTCIEIAEGLEVGARVILSDMSAWEAHERIRLH